jgi:uncharacterized protein YukE
MSQIHATPELLREFADDLAQFVGLVDQSTEELRGQLGKLASSWRDSQFQEFSEAFTRTEQDLKTFREQAGHIIPRLREDASTLEQYQKLHLR